MTRRRRRILVLSLFVLTICNALFLLINFGGRVKGHMYHTTEAANGVVDELVARDVLKISSMFDDWNLYWEVIANPIEPHIDPFYEVAVYPMMFNVVTLGLLWIVVLLPSRVRPTKTFGAK